MMKALQMEQARESQLDVVRAVGWLKGESMLFVG